MMLHRLALICALAIAACAPLQAAAQQSVILRNPANSAPFGTPANPIVTSGAAFAPVAPAPAPLAVGTSSTRVAFTAGAVGILTNNSAVDFSYRLGNSSVAALTTDPLLPAGRSVAVAIGANTHVAAITASGAASLVVVTGTGTPAFSGGGGNGGGGGAAGTEYTEDAAAATNPVGGIMICRRRDTLSASEVSADLDNVAVNCTSKGQLHTFVEGTITANLGTIAGVATSALQTALNGYVDGVEAQLTTLDGRVDGVETLIAATNTKLDSALTSLATILTNTDRTADVAESSTPSTVNLTQLGGSAVATGSGAVGATTQRVVLPTDQPPLTAYLAATTTGGCTPGVYRSAASNNSTNIKVSAGTLCKLVLINTTATLYYARFYNGGSAPTCSSGTGEVAMYPIPASTTGAGVAVQLGPFGEAYATGIGFCITGGGAANDNTSAATGVTLAYSYK